MISLGIRKFVANTPQSEIVFAETGATVVSLIPKDGYTEILLFISTVRLQYSVVQLNTSLGFFLGKCFVNMINYNMLSTQIKHRYSAGFEGHKNESWAS